MTNQNITINDVTPEQAEWIIRRMDGMRRHKLLTKADRKALPALYSQDGKGGEATVAVKLFSSSFTWYVLEFDGEDTFFGLVVNEATGEKGYGYASYFELATTKSPWGIPAVERDKWFSACTLDEARK